MIRTVTDLLIQAASKRPEKEAVLHKDEALTYAQIYEKSLSLGQTLIRLGIKKGDRVCFYLEKRLEKVISIFAISLAGAVFVPIRRLSLPAQALYIINNCGASALITTSSRLPGLNCHHNLQAVVTVDTSDFSLPEGSVVAWDEAIVDNLLQREYPTSIATDVAAILYTSGSTGQPKGVVLSHQNIVAGAQVVSEYLKSSENDRLLSILTFGFDYGLNQLTMSFLNCAQLVLFDYLFPKDILKIVEKYQITGLAAVATTWLQLLQKSWEGSAMHKLRYITNSGGTIPSNYVAELQKRLPDTEIYIMYGLTEAFRSTYLKPSLVDHYPTSIGKAIPGEEIMVLDKNDQPVKPGQTGELVHRGVLVAQGYWDDPEMTSIRFKQNPLQHKETPIPEMVVYSGDYVRIDKDGFLYFIGRKDEMIKCAGNRISPTEVEDILYNSGFISEAVAMGKPHDIYGQVVLVVLTLLPQDKKSKNDILLYCRDNMPSYMVPHEIIVRDELPKNSNEKLDRSAIKKEVLAKRNIVDTDER